MSGSSKRAQRARKKTGKRTQGKTAAPLDTNRLEPDTQRTSPAQRSPHRREEKSRFLHRLSGWLSLLFDSTWKVVMEGIAVVTGLPTVWALFAVVPIVAPPASVDPVDAFRTSFSVSNDDRFFTLYDVDPVCVLDETLGVFAQEFGLAAEENIKDLPPQSGPAKFTCRIEGRPATPGLRLKLVMHYNVRILFYPWPKVHEYVYSVSLNGEGKPEWVEGEWLHQLP